MGTPCVCELAGFCERHGIKKSEEWHKLCRTKIEYFKAWDTGIGPGQVRGISDVDKARRAERITERTKFRNRLRDWLIFFSRKEDRGLGSTIARLLGSPKDRSIKSELVQTLKRASCKEQLAIDGLNNSYPNPNYIGSKNGCTRAGDSIKFYVSQFGLKIDTDCGCSTWVDTLNAMGIDLCLQKIPRIVTIIHTEAITQGLPFNVATANQLVYRALIEAKNNLKNSA